MLTTVHSCTCPQEIAATNHKIRNQTERWNDPEYHAIEDKLLKDNPTCQYCGINPSEVAHHDEDWMYKDKAAYYDPANMTPACRPCHYWYRRGFVVCPECKKIGEVHYMRRGSESCHRHRKYTTKFRRNRSHSCDWNNGNQKCGNPLRRDRVCLYSSRDAVNRCDPDHFMARKRAGVPA